MAALNELVNIARLHVQQSRRYDFVVNLNWKSVIFQKNYNVCDSLALLQDPFWQAEVYVETNQIDRLFVDTIIIVDLNHTARTVCQKKTTANIPRQTVFWSIAPRINYFQIHSSLVTSNTDIW